MLPEITFKMFKNEVNRKWNGWREKLRIVYNYKAKNIQGFQEDTALWRSIKENKQCKNESFLVKWWGCMI